MGRKARALLEERRKVVRTHAGDRRELRKAEILRQIVADIVQDHLEAANGQASLVDDRHAAPHGVTTRQVHRQRIRQRLSIQSPDRRALQEICRHGLEQPWNVVVD